MFWVILLFEEDFLVVFGLLVILCGIILWVIRVGVGGEGRFRLVSSCFYFEVVV